MKKVSYMVKPMKSIWGVTIRILSKEAAMKAMSYEFTGFTIDDAVANANSKLNKVGYTIKGEATAEEMEAYLDMV